VLSAYRIEGQECNLEIQLTSTQGLAYTIQPQNVTEDKLTQSTFPIDLFLDIVESAFSILRSYYRVILFLTIYGVLPHLYSKLDCSLKF
jgi:hypothetical protein